MKMLYFILLLVTTTFAYPKEKELSVERSVTNHFAKIKDVPYVGLIRDDSGGYGYYCGVTILTKDWLLTAAKCVLWGTKPSSPADILVWTGVNSLPLNESMHQIEEIYIHEQYIKNSVDHNIALLKLKTSLQIGDNRKPISIIKSNEELQVGDLLQVNGFPISSDRSVKSLTSVSMEVVDQDLCEKKYSEINNLSSTGTFCGKVINKCSYNEVCAFNYGDSAIANGKLVGILTEETVQNYPGIFTNLGHYYDWIVKNIPEQKE